MPLVNMHTGHHCACSLTTHGAPAASASAVAIVGTMGVELRAYRMAPVAISAATSTTETARARRMSPRLLRLGRFAFAFTGRTRARRRHEQARAVGQDQIAAVGAVRAVLRAKADDRDLGAGLDGFASEAAAQQRIRRSAFDHPWR